MIIRIIIIIFVFLFNISSSKEIQKLRNEIPYYPGSVIYKLDNHLKAPIDAIVVKANFYEIVNFYYKNMKKNGWKLVFPDELEAKIWTEALNKYKNKNPVIILIFKKNKYNCYINISAFNDTKYSSSIIISIYINMVE